MSILDLATDDERAVTEDLIAWIDRVLVEYEARRSRIRRMHSEYSRRRRHRRG